ncbi:DUF4229 domain-containing protein [Nocardiopsis coralliicola]
MRSVLAYTAARLLLFGVSFAVLYLLGARGLLAAFLAVLVSGLVSYVLLSRQRDAVSSGIAGTVARMRGMGDRLEQGAAHEDSAQRPGSAPEAPESLRDFSRRRAGEGGAAAEDGDGAEGAPASGAEAGGPDAGSGAGAADSAPARG